MKIKVIVCNCLISVPEIALKNVRCCNDKAEILVVSPNTCPPSSKKIFLLPSTSFATKGAAYLYTLTRGSMHGICALGKRESLSPPPARSHSLGPLGELA